ncbi:MAG TPA: protein phosphatase 2C domain-containing protein [Candidatus Hydrogenedentes bacterium]|nr:protein phosphatase 2C domain-containing protein [Candidatus Hydrogenedentota bacterium]
MPAAADLFQLYAFGATDVGRRREANEDAFFVSEEQGLFIVSDGMGGAPAGDLASAAVVQTLPLQVAAKRMAWILGKAPDPQNVGEGLVQAIGYVNDMLLEKTRGIPESEGLGATVVAGLYAGQGVLAVAHLGDSRAYLLRNGYFELLTNDHTMANMLFRAGRISRDELLRHPARHVLTRHIGMDDCPAADIGLLPLSAGDRILFCSDGLTGMLQDEEIGTILTNNKDREEACRHLIARANEEGGVDNITVVIVDVEGPEPFAEQRSQKIVVRESIGQSLAGSHEEKKQEEDAFLQL